MFINPTRAHIILAPPLWLLRVNLSKLILFFQRSWLLINEFPSFLLLIKVCTCLNKPSSSLLQLGKFPMKIFRFKSTIYEYLSHSKLWDESIWLSCGIKQTNLSVSSSINLRDVWTTLYFRIIVINPYFIFKFLFKMHQNA